jgi:hypothetical protein
LVSFSDLAPREPDFKYADYHSVFGLTPDTLALREVLRGSVAIHRDRLEQRTAHIDGALPEIVSNIVAAGQKLEL